MLAKGEWNHVIVALGVPGTGKSTWAVERLLQLMRTPAYGLAHDPGWRLPAKLPDGQATNLRRFETIEEGEAALAKDPKGILAFSTADGAEVIKLGMKLSKASMALHGGTYGNPVVVLLDEAVGTESANPYRLGKELRQLIALRRHYHLGLIITAQSPELLHYAILGLATEVQLFRLHDADSLKRLERIGTPKEVIMRVPVLPDYQSISVKLG